MNITWHGQSACKIQEKEVTIAIDPFENAGVKLSKFQADIVLLTPSGMKEKEITNVKGDPFFISDPGEYEVKNIFVYGTTGNIDEDPKERITLYLIEIGGITVGHLGALKQATLSDAQLEVLEGCDVLLIPVGGKEVIDAKEAVKIVGQIQPRVVIPLYHKVKGITAKVDSVDAFIKEMGVKAEKIDKAKISKKDLPQEEIKLLVLDKS